MAVIDYKEEQNQRAAVAFILIGHGWYKFCIPRRIFHAMETSGLSLRALIKDYLL